MSVYQSNAQYRKALDTTKSFEALEADFRNIGNAGYKAGVLALDTHDGINTTEQRSLMNMAWHVLNHGDANKVAALGALLADSLMSGGGTRANAAGVQQLLATLYKTAQHRHNGSDAVYLDLQNTVEARLNQAVAADLAVIGNENLQHIMSFGLPSTTPQMQQQIIDAAKQVVAEGTDAQRRALGRVLGAQAMLSTDDKSILGELETEFMGSTTQAPRVAGHQRDFATMFASMDNAMEGKPDIEQQINMLPMLIRANKTDAAFLIDFSKNIASQLGGALDNGVSQGFAKIAIMLRDLFSNAKMAVTADERQIIINGIFGQGADLEKLAEGDIKGGLPSNAENFMTSLTGRALQEKVNNASPSDAERAGLRKILPVSIAAVLLLAFAGDSTAAAAPTPDPAPAPTPDPAPAPAPDPANPDETDPPSEE